MIEYQQKLISQFFKYQPSRLSSTKPHLPVIKEPYGYFTHALFSVAVADIDQIRRIS